MTRKPVLVALVTVATLATLVAVLHANVIQGVFGKKLSIKDAKKYRLVWTSKDATIDPTTFLAVTNGASIFYTAEATPSRFGQAVMPAVGWVEKKGTLKYTDKAHVYGPITAVKVKAGALSVAAKDVFIPILNAPMATRIALQLNSGEQSFCALFPGLQGLIKKNDPTKGVFLSINAEANSGSCAQLID